MSVSSEIGLRIPSVNSLFDNGMMLTLGLMPSVMVNSGDNIVAPAPIRLGIGSLIEPVLRTPPVTVPIVENCNGSLAEARRILVTSTSSRDFAKTRL